MDLFTKRIVHQPLPFFQTWMKIADGLHQDLSCPDMYGHIVWTLSQMQAKDAVWTFADWALQRNQKVHFFPICHAPNCRGHVCATQPLYVLHK